jgi:hypothetical protein
MQQKFCYIGGFIFLDWVKKQKNNLLAVFKPNPDKRLFQNPNPRIGVD